MTSEDVSFTHLDYKATTTTAVNTVSHVGPEVLTADVMKISIFWNISRFCLHLLSRWFLAWLRPWRWRRHIPPKRRLTSNGLHGVISQKTELFMISPAWRLQGSFQILRPRAHQGTLRSKLSCNMNLISVLGRRNTKETGNRNATAISENC
jgi:hypothetical protein